MWGMFVVFGGFVERGVFVGVLKETVKAMEAAGNKPAQWIYDMLASGANSFYKTENGKRLYYDIPSKSYKLIPGTESFILLDSIRASKTVWKNSGTTLIDR